MTAKRLRTAYIGIVVAIGVLICVWSLLTLPDGGDPLILLLLAVLNIIAQSLASSSKGQVITFGVSQSVNLAAVALYGIQYGVLMAIIANFSLWVTLTARREDNWRGSFEQLLFNSGMEPIYTVAAGFVLVMLQNRLGDTSLFGRIIPWFAAAIINDQINIWMVALIVYLQKRIHPFKFWLKSGWAMPLNIGVGAVGGFALAAVVGAMGWTGILVFLLPLALMGYSFRMYVSATNEQILVTQKHANDLEAANARMREMAREKDNMLAVLSHDMRTTISSIHTSIEMLLDPTLALPREQTLRLLKVIAHSEQALSGMVDNILRLEEEDTQNLLPEREFFNMTSVVENIVASLEAQAGEKHVRLHSFGGDIPAYIEADRKMVQQIVLNLVSNAIKYTPEKGSVFVSLQMKDDQVVLDVEDTGYGIPKSELEHIFEPYYRVGDHEDKAVGTGLGLSIVRRFVKAHEGKIEVATELGVGSRFTVHLPMLSNVPYQPSTRASDATFHGELESFDESLITKHPSGKRSSRRGTPQPSVR